MAIAKTSESHPLRIDTVRVGNVGGTIGLTLCPGKKQRDARSGIWDRDFSTDLEAVRSFGAKALVSLMERDELVRMHVSLAQLSVNATELGMEWHHLPVKDVSIPDTRFEDFWAYSGLRLRKFLRSGEKIVIHCLGGLGRTGTIAARLLVEFGNTPEEAIQQVRRARPGSIETTEQEEYVRNCKPLASADESLSREERALACLLGGAVGDAFGYAVEFSSMNEIRKSFGPAGITFPVFQAGRLVVSDDTQMTLFTLEGLLRVLEGSDCSAGSRVESIRLAYLDWLKTQKNNDTRDTIGGQGWLVTQPEMHVRRAPGNTCMSALTAGGRGTIRKAINGSKGCGGVMRVAPIGLVRKLGLAETFQLATEAAALTHGHPSGYLSAGMMASIIWLLTRGTDLKTATEESCEILMTYRGHEETLEVVRRALVLPKGKPTDFAANIEGLGSGWVGEEALAIALYAVLSAESFDEAVRIAANHGGDSDSTASLAGQFWGAMNGLEGMPHTWVSAVDVMFPMLHLARRLMLHA